MSGGTKIYLDKGKVFLEGSGGSTDGKVDSETPSPVPKDAPVLAGFHGGLGGGCDMGGAPELH